MYVLEKYWKTYTFLAFLQKVRRVPRFFKNVEIVGIFQKKTRDYEICHVTMKLLSPNVEIVRVVQFNPGNFSKKFHLLYDFHVRPTFSTIFQDLSVQPVLIRRTSPVLRFLRFLGFPRLTKSWGSQDYIVQWKGPVTHTKVV